jgi:hypothetical protein
MPPGGAWEASQVVTGRQARRERLDRPGAHRAGHAPVVRRCRPGGHGTGPPAALIPSSPPATGSPRHGPSPTGTVAPCTGWDRDGGPLYRLRPPPGLDQDRSLTPKEPHPRHIEGREGYQAHAHAAGRASGQDTAVRQGTRPTSRTADPVSTIHWPRRAQNARFCAHPPNVTFVGRPAMQSARSRTTPPASGIGHRASGIGQASGVQDRDDSGSGGRLCREARR